MAFALLMSDEQKTTKLIFQPISTMISVHSHASDQPLSDQSVQLRKIPECLNLGHKRIERFF